MRPKLPVPIFLATLSLAVISLSVLFSISKSQAYNQLIFWAIGFSVLFLTSLFDFRIFGKIAIPLYITSIVLLLILLIFASPVRGSVRWIELGFFRFQPSEIAKVGTILLLAHFYTQRSAKNLRSLLISLVIILPPMFLTLRQPDIGNSLAFLAIWLGISLASGFRKRLLLSFLILPPIVALAAYQFLVPYQRERITSFLDPASDPLGTGYHIIQSKIAIGSGQLFGRGLGFGSQSTLNFLPEAQSDFIFAATSEQLGLLGSGFLITVYFWLIYKILNINMADRFAKLITSGIVSFLIFQFTVNIGMNLGLVPITGITLPLISYGGSSLISTLFLIGIAVSAGYSRSTQKYFT